MFKDYDKYLSTSLKVYIFVLIFTLILKLTGINYFGLDLNNPTLVNINYFCFKYHLVYVWQTITLYLYVYMDSAIICKTKKVKKLTLIFMPLMILSKIICLKSQIASFFLDILVFAIITLIKKGKVRRTFFVLFLNLVYQIISLTIRDKTIIIEQDDFIQSIIFNFDYLLMLIITYKVYFIYLKGGKKIWADGEAFLSLLKKISLKKLLTKLQKNLRNFKALPKQEKLSISIYIILSLLWNTLSVVIILLVANLNHTFIECIFILTSFWLSKHAFGKPFHLPSMIQCFIVSNLTYYILNRITTPLGISIFVPILLGVGLSYVTSKLVKKTYKPLYRGMPKELFNETILKIVDKDSIKYKICYDFYINKKSDLSLSFEYNYSIAGIRKIKDRINDKIKELN